ncbi:hypothetical protein ACTMSW_26415 [Micromonospora sp. BQ11]|uniref:hypothetical protein n=1 Tax=Micromonospora sp. BQ11 TaxID=3452212 RepID=UPI003F8B2A52
MDTSDFLARFAVYRSVDGKDLSKNLGRKFNKRTGRSYNRGRRRYDITRRSYREQRNSAREVRIATDYIVAFFESQIAAQFKSVEGQIGQFDVSVLSDDGDLSSITKRGSLVANQLIVSHESPGIETVDEIEHFEGVSTVHVTELRLRGVPVSRLGKYLDDCIPMIQAGRLLYFPRVTTRQWSEETGPVAGGYLGAEGFDDDSSIAQLFELMVRGRTILHARPDSPLSRHLIEPILTVDLPYLEGTSLRDFCKIAIDETEALRSTQAYFRLNALNVADGGRGVDDFALARLSMEIGEGVRALESELRRINRKTAVQAAGAALATVSATLVAIYGPQLADVISIIGASGGAWSAANAAELYMDSKSRIRERPVYFLWLLSKRARSL